MKPDVSKAIEVLEKVKLTLWNQKSTTLDVTYMALEALGWLKGYELPPEVLEKYRCTFCGMSGVKLWRGWGTAAKSWCSKCGTEQAGVEDTVDEDGRIQGTGKYNEHTKSDQIYSPDKGQNLVPWVPNHDGSTWGYMSIPFEGVQWWRSLPTRKETISESSSP